MIAMSKQQLADAAGVSVNTLMNWCKPYREQLAQIIKSHGWHRFSICHTEITEGIARRPEGESQITEILLSH